MEQLTVGERGIGKAGLGGTGQRHSCQRLSHAAQAKKGSALGRLRQAVESVTVGGRGGGGDVGDWRRRWLSGLLGQRGRARYGRLRKLKQAREGGGGGTF